MLGHCSDCKEKSIAVKIYTRRKDSKQKRVEYCINKGCGYRKVL